MNKIYPTDLTDTQWSAIVQFLDETCNRKYPLYTIWNAIFYLLKTGCQWRMLPKEYPKWELVYYYIAKMAR
jgi:putative transposase